MTRLSRLFAAALVRLLTARPLRWLWDLRVFPERLDRSSGIPYSRRVLGMFHWLRRVSAHLPRCAALWAIGGDAGKAFAGNSAFLFLHHSARRGNRAEMVWITQSRPVLAMLRGRGYRALDALSIGGLIACGFAGIHIISHHEVDTNLWVSEGVRRLQLWHGLPIKKLLWDVESPESPTWQFIHTWHGRSEAFWRLRTPWNFGYGNHWAYASIGALFADRLTQAFHGDRSAFQTLGFPRNDYILDPDPAFEWMLGDSLDTWKAVQASGRKVILYLPTWRELSGAAAADRPIFQDWAELDRLLAERDMVLLFKDHGAEAEARLAPPAGGNIIVIPRRVDCTYLMAGADALVTDYSSVYVDFLLLDRPIGFFWFDEDFYLRREHELYPDMLECLPGQVLRSLDDWRAFLDTCRRGDDPCAQARRRERDRLYEVQDGGSCERIVAFLESSMERCRS